MKDIDDGVSLEVKMKNFQVSPVINAGADTGRYAMKAPENISDEVSSIIESGKDDILPSQVFSDIGEVSDEFYDFFMRTNNLQISKFREG